jgi:hypothetical protein
MNFDQRRRLDYDENKSIGVGSGGQSKQLRSMYYLATPAIVTCWYPKTMLLIWK